MIQARPSMMMTITKTVRIIVPKVTSTLCIGANVTCERMFHATMKAMESIACICVTGRLSCPYVGKESREVQARGYGVVEIFPLEGSRGKGRPKSFCVCRKYYRYRHWVDPRCGAKHSYNGYARGTSLIAAGVYTYLVDVNLWSTVYGILVTAGAFYTFVIQRFEGKADDLLYV
jgi:hypothetical protein